MVNTRRTYILNVICNRLYFGEIQEEVLGQCSGQGISEARTESLFAISGLFQKKANRVEEMPL